MKNIDFNGDRVKADIEEFKAGVEDFLSGKMDPDAFRKVRLWRGLYQQLGTYMLRVKVPYGQLTSEMWRGFADCAEKYARGWAHLTTRQDIELHWVRLEDAVKIMEALAPVGLTSREGCGDTLRNVTGDPLAGISSDEAFDIRPYAQMTKDVFLFRGENQALPRKFKITFSGSDADRGITAMHEIGYIAQLRDGQRGFRVTAAGGLGREPRLAKTMAEFLPEEDLNFASAAILKLFNDHGNRENRKKARLKYVMDQWGEKEFQRVFEENLAHFKSGGHDDLKRFKPSDYDDWFQRELPTDGGELPQREDEEYKAWAAGNVHPQPQPGLSWVESLVYLGDLTTEQMREIADLSDRFCEGESRITAAQNLVLPNVRNREVGEVYDALAALKLTRKAAGHAGDIVSCPGTDFCEIAFGSSRTAAMKLHEMLEAQPADDGLADIKIRISGCPNACGHHHIGNIGLIGFNNPNVGAEISMFQILIGGGTGERNALGKRAMGKAVPVEKVPEAIHRITSYYREKRAEKESFTAFYDRVGIDGFKQEVQLRDLVD